MSSRERKRRGAAGREVLDFRGLEVEVGGNDGGGAGSDLGENGKGVDELGDIEAAEWMPLQSDAITARGVVEVGGLGALMLHHLLPYHRRTYRNWRGF